MKIVDRITIVGFRNKPYELQRITEDYFANWRLGNDNGTYYSDYRNIIFRADNDNNFAYHKPIKEQERAKLIAFIEKHKAEKPTDAELKWDYDEKFEHHLPMNYFSRYPHRLLKPTD